MYNKLKVLLVVLTILIGIQTLVGSTLLYEDFEATQFPPTGWDTVKTATCRAWMRRTSGQVFRTGGSAGILIASTDARTGTSFLRTPAVNFSSTGIESLSFYFRCPGLAEDYAFSSRLDTIKVDVSTNLTTWTRVLTLDSNYIRNLPQQITVRDTGYKLTAGLSAFNGQTTVYIRWMVYDNYAGLVGTNRYFNIDSIYVYDRPVGIEESKITLSEESEFQICPNPFTNFTNINLNTNPLTIREIKIYDATGNIIKTLKATTIWDGRDEKGNLVETGIYFVVLETINQTKVKKITVLR